jgi:hypothetical protein
MQHLKDLALVLYVATAYFVSTYFAVLGLAPSLALSAAYFTSMGALVIFELLVLAGQEKEGAPAGCLYFLPAIILAAGIIWWGARLVGLWG